MCTFLSHLFSSTTNPPSPSPSPSNTPISNPSHSHPQRPSGPSRFMSPAPSTTCGGYSRSNATPPSPRNVEFPFHNPSYLRSITHSSSNPSSTSNPSSQHRSTPRPDTPHNLAHEGNPIISRLEAEAEAEAIGNSKKVRFLNEKSVLRANGTVYRDIMEDNEWKKMVVKTLEEERDGEREAEAE